MHTDKQGNWFVVWSTTAFSAPDYGNRNVAISHSNDDGETWTPVSPLNANMRFARDGFNAHPVLATDNQGVWISAWNTSQLSFGATTFYENVLFAVTTDISIGPDPPLEALLLIDVLAGRVVLDHNGDGVIDAADLAELLEKLQQEADD